jgi:hypothetical protein
VKPRGRVWEQRIVGHGDVPAVELSMHTPHLYDASLDDSGVRELPDASALQDIGAADGILVGLRQAEERAGSFSPSAAESTSSALDRRQNRKAGISLCVDLLR